jgi:hypothetical protein
MVEVDTAPPSFICKENEIQRQVIEPIKGVDAEFRPKA